MNESTTPAPTMSRWDRLVSLLPKQEWVIIGWVRAIKVLLFVVGPKSVAIFDNKRLHGLRECLEMWNRWDSLIFQRLAHHGYHVPFDLRAWPLFPLVHSAHWPFHRRLFHQRVTHFQHRVHHRGNSLAQSCPARLCECDCATRRLVFSYLSDGLHSSRRLYGKFFSGTDVGLFYG